MLNNFFMKAQNNKKTVQKNNTKAKSQNNKANQKNNKSNSNNTKKNSKRTKKENKLRARKKDTEKTEIPKEAPLEKKVKKEVTKKEGKVVNEFLKKEEVKKQKEIENKKAIVIIGIALIIVLVLFYFVFFYSPYKYQFSVSGLTYKSNYYTPNEFFNIVKEQDAIFISPVLEEGRASPIIANAMNIWQVVLIMNDINAIQLIRVVDEDNELMYCYTNNGNPENSTQLTIDECDEIRENNYVINIEEGKEQVIIGENSVSIYSSESSSSLVSFAVLKEIFPNAQESLDKVNEKIYGIN
jgi:flagellar biosynthesis GTPase FlhF